MTTTHRSLARLATLALPVAGALVGCASGSGSGSSALTGAAILTLEDDLGDAQSRETMTMLRLPLPGLGARDTAAVEWSQIETRAAADRASVPMSVDAQRQFALIAGETGVSVVRFDDRVREGAALATGQPVASVSLAASGRAAALSEDGATLYLLSVTPDDVAADAEFPIDLALGDGARATSALLSNDGALAILDAGRSRLAMLHVSRTPDGAVSLEKIWERPTGRGLASAAWSPDGSTLVLTERMLPDELTDGVDIVAAAGRVSFYPVDGSEPARAMLPGRPGAVAFDRRGARVVTVIDRPEGPALALVAASSGSATLLDWKPLGAHAAGLSFDARGRHVLVAMPALGALAVWAIDGATLRNTDMLVDTGPGVSAVAVAGD